MPHFPHMEGASSDDWHGFLNAQTGLDVPLDEMNATAFDKWRQSLAQQGYPVWGINQKRLDDIAKRGAELLAAAKKLADVKK